MGRARGAGCVDCRRGPYTLTANALYIIIFASKTIYNSDIATQSSVWTVEQTKHMSERVVARTRTVPLWSMTAVVLRVSMQLQKIGVYSCTG